MKRRYCPACKQPFLPHPKAGERQKTCSKEAYQRERHRLACERWRKAPERVAERLEAAVVRLDPVEGTPAISRVDWVGVRDAVGVKVGIVLELLVKVVSAETRDAVNAKERIIPALRANLVPRRGKDATARGRAPP